MNESEESHSYNTESSTNNDEYVTYVKTDHGLNIDADENNILKPELNDQGYVENSDNLLTKECAIEITEPNGYVTASLRDKEGSQMEEFKVVGNYVSRDFIPTLANPLLHVQVLPTITETATPDVSYVSANHSGKEGTPAEELGVADYDSRVSVPTSQGQISIERVLTAVSATEVPKHDSSYITANSSNNKGTPVEEQEVDSYVAHTLMPTFTDQISDEKAPTTVRGTEFSPDDVSCLLPSNSIKKEAALEQVVVDGYVAYTDQTTLTDQVSNEKAQNTASVIEVPKHNINYVTANSSNNKGNSSNNKGMQMEELEVDSSVTHTLTPTFTDQISDEKALTTVRGTKFSPADVSCLLPSNSSKKEAALEQLVVDGYVEHTDQTTLTDQISNEKAQNTASATKVRAPDINYVTGNSSNNKGMQMEELEVDSYVAHTLIPTSTGQISNGKAQKTVCATEVRAPDISYVTANYSSNDGTQMEQRVVDDYVSHAFLPTLINQISPAKTPMCTYVQ